MTNSAPISSNIALAPLDTKPELRNINHCYVRPCDHLPRETYDDRSIFWNGRFLHPLTDMLQRLLIHLQVWEGVRPGHLLRFGLSGNSDACSWLMRSGVAIPRLRRARPVIEIASPAPTAAYRISIELTNRPATDLLQTSRKPQRASSCHPDWVLRATRGRSGSVGYRI